MYLPKTGNKYTILYWGSMGILFKVVLLFIIIGIIATLLNLFIWRIAIEHRRHLEGDFRWAITKNGEPVKWLQKTPKV